VSSATRARASWVEAHVRAHCFGATGDATRSPLTFGAELELLAVDARSHRVTPIFPGLGPCSLDVVRDVAVRLDWTERRSSKGAPLFASARGGVLTFEPGGQLEYASAVHRSVDDLARELDDVERALRASADCAGIELLAYGVDPYNGPADAPLQLDAPRYRRMASYFATIGADGARMMRQTASLQLCIGGIDLCARWHLANSLAPVLVALFANSRRYAGEDTGSASHRAETWRGVDPSRTGVLEGRDPVREYAAFALGAPAFLVGDADDAPMPFEELPDDAVDSDALAAHLSTLFPESRPRGYLELRSLDAMDSAQRRAALVFVAGLVADDASAAAAAELLGDPDPDLLRAAGRAGPAEPRIRALVPDLLDLALAGCGRLGESVVSDALVAAAMARR
jgi:glutamate--cysteine ligase